MVEQSESQLGELRKQLRSSEEEATFAKQELERTTKELERATPFEKEVREKNLLIGKLRHEAVILNDHLTKALRFLKQRKPEDMVDRYVERALSFTPSYLDADVPQTIGYQYFHSVPRARSFGPQEVPDSSVDLGNPLLG